MTIPEAVSLVVQAGAIGGRGQVYVLDMGEPVKILDLASNMIRLSGKDARRRDIAITFVGVRPGEKLHEELWTDGETVGPTAHPKILARRAAADRRRVAPGRSSTSSNGWSSEGETLDVVSRLTAMLREPQAGRRAVLRRHSPLTRHSHRPARSVRCTGGPEPIFAGLNPEQRRAVEAVRGPGLHPRRCGLGQDDDDHAPDREPGGDRRVRAARDPCGHVHGQGGDRDASSGWSALGVGGVSARTFHSAALRQLHRLGDPPDRIMAVEGAAAAAAREHAAAAVQVPPGRRSRDRDRVGEEPAAHAGDLSRRSRRPRAADPAGPDAPHLPRVRGARRPSAASSTSRTCSS